MLVWGACASGFWGTKHHGRGSACILKSRNHAHFTSGETEAQARVQWVHL